MLLALMLAVALLLTGSMTVQARGGHDRDGGHGRFDRVDHVDKGSPTDKAMPAPSPQAGTSLSTSLLGANEAPGPGDPDGSGTAFVGLNLEQSAVCFRNYVQGIDDVVAAHIHRGPAGVAGPVVVDFKGRLHGCVDGINPDLLRAIQRDPASYYVNIHTAAYPDGAIRGQLGGNVQRGVPSSGSPSSGGY
jgi:hypothetical protein